MNLYRVKATVKDGGYVKPNPNLPETSVVGWYDLDVFRDVYASHEASARLQAIKLVSLNPTFRNKLCTILSCELIMIEV